MGRFIDRAALTLSGAVLFYALFLGAGNGILASAALAFVCMGLLRFAVERRPRRYRCSAGQAKAAVEAISRMPVTEAEQTLRALLADTLSDGCPLLPLLRYPESRLSAGELFSIWREYRREPRVCVACTCPGSSEALSFAREQRAPELTVVDARDLAMRVRRTGICAPAEAPRVPLRRRLGRAVQRTRNRPRSLRTPLYALGMWGFYLLRGNPLYLVGSTVVMFAFVASYIHHRAPSRGA